MDHPARAVPGSPPRPEPRRARSWSVPARRRRGDERGAVLVEAAIILPVLLLVVLGIVEYSLAFKNSLAVSSATRSGARTASAQPRQEAFADNAAAAVAVAMSAIDQAAPQELWIYEANSSGMPDSNNFVTCSECVRYRWDGDDWGEPFYEGWTYGEQNACSGEADTIGVYVRAEHRFMTSLFGSARTLEDHTVMRLEPIPTSAQCRP